MTQALGSELGTPSTRTFKHIGETLQVLVFKLFLLYFHAQYFVSSKTNKFVLQLTKTVTIQAWIAQSVAHWLSTM